ncbi:MAG: PIN domain-containing protein [Chloroflexi bacterium]|nr:PIN domain-containing protein [Chloroflexota bacterium]
MAISVNATVVDLRNDQPKPEDVFLVDSNVWYWVGYSNASLSDNYNQSVDYPTYVNNAVNNGSSLYRCNLSFAELAHSIERSQRNIFNKLLRPKDFRHTYPNERQIVATEIENVWNLVDAITAGNAIETNLTDSFIAQSLSRLKSEALDGYDAFMVEAMLSMNIVQVITDDSDFGQVAGITVFTAHERLIKQAASQGKLQRR